MTTVTELGDRVVRNLAHQAMEFIHLTSPGIIQRVIARLLTLYKADFKAVVELQPSLVKNMMTLSVADASLMIGANNTTMRQRRRDSIMHQKFFGFRLYPSEHKQRAYEKEQVKIISREKLESGMMLLVRTASATAATLCGFVKVASLPNYIEELIEQVGQFNIKHWVLDWH